MIVALSPDRFGGRRREGDGRAAVEARAQLIECWPVSDLTNLIEEIVGERHASQGRTRLELAMERLRHVAYLDHEGEDADDVAIYDARKAELAAAGDVLPPEVSAGVLHGDRRLKAIRNWRGETQLHLAFNIGIGQGYLSDLDSGRRTGTPKTIAKLAQALDVPLAWLS